MIAVTQATGTAFPFGSHVRYLGPRIRELSAGSVVLIPGMVGAVTLSSGPGADWHCLVQFRNGYQVEVTPENRGQFEPAHCSYPGMVGAGI